MGLALVPTGKAVIVYVADSLNDRVRVIEPDGTIATLGGQRALRDAVALAYHPAGWLYVKDASPTA